MFAAPFVVSRERVLGGSPTTESSSMGIVHIPADEIPQEMSAIEGPGFTSTVSRFEAHGEAPGAWHHHGEHHVVALLISGTIRIESGPGGRVVTDPAPGDLVHIEPGTIHRETYDGTVELVGFTMGAGPGRVDVEGPDPG